MKQNSLSEVLQPAQPDDLVSPVRHLVPATLHELALLAQRRKAQTARSDQRTPRRVPLERRRRCHRRRLRQSRLDRRRRMRDRHGRLSVLLMHRDGSSLRNLVLVGQAGRARRGQDGIVDRAMPDGRSSSSTLLSVERSKTLQTRRRPVRARMTRVGALVNVIGPTAREGVGERGRLGRGRRHLRRVIVAYAWDRGRRSCRNV